MSQTPILPPRIHTAEETTALREAEIARNAERVTERPTAPTTATAAQLVERIDNLHAELVALLGLAVRSCPAPTSDRARRYQSVDLSSIHGLQRLLGHDVARLRNSVQQLHAANDLAALHDARATGRNVPATEPAR